MIRFFSLFVLVLVLGLPASAQVVLALETGGTGQTLEVYLPSTTHPFGGPGHHGGFANPAFAALGPVQAPLGGIAVDQVNKLIFATDGFQIATVNHPLYETFSPSAPPPPPVYMQVSIVGVLTGMGADPRSGLLWVTDGYSYSGLTLGAPFGLVVPPLPLPFALPPSALLTGIDFDDATGTLWACDNIGNIYNWAPAGVPVGPQPVSVLAGASTLPLVGIAVNESNGPGAVPPHFCSNELGGYHVVVTDGAALRDALNPSNPPIPMSLLTVVLNLGGLAFSSDFQVTSAQGPSIILPPTVLPGIPGWERPTINDVGGPNVLRLTSALPNAPVLFLHDLCPLSYGWIDQFTGNILWINPFSPTLSIAPLMTDAMGEIHAPVDWSGAPAGLNLVGQFAVGASFAPSGYLFTDLIHFEAGRP